MVMALKSGKTITEKAERAFETMVIHDGYDSQDACNLGAVVPPIHTTTTFDLSQQEELLYTRLGNPSRLIFERRLAALEGTKYCSAFSSGMAAINAIVTACCKSGDNIVIGKDMYPGAIAFFSNIVPRYGVSVKWVTMADHGGLREAIDEKTKIVWVESMSNPMLIMERIDLIGKLVKNANSDGKPFFVVDNTFFTPCFMNPTKYGADIVVHSATKYLNGHCDVLAGAVMTNDELIAKELKWMQQELGAVPSPFECHLACRGLKTLAVRMERHMQNGLKLAEFLSKHPRVEKVIHPGLPTYEHAASRKALQVDGYPGMLAFILKGSEKDAEKFAKKLKIAKYATSLGAPETLVCVTYFMLAPTLHEIGVDVDWMRHSSLVRVSVGLESATDLVADFEQALRLTSPSE